MYGRARGIFLGSLPSYLQAPRHVTESNNIEDTQALAEGKHEFKFLYLGDTIIFNLMEFQLFHFNSRDFIYTHTRIYTHINIVCDNINFCDAWE